MANAWNLYGWKNKFREEMDTMNGKKKLRKRLTAFLMTLVMVMTLVMSVEPMQVRAATVTRSSYTITQQYCNLTSSTCPLKVGDIFLSEAQIKIDSELSSYYYYFIYIDGSKQCTLNQNIASSYALTKGYNYEVTNLSQKNGNTWEIYLKTLKEASVKTAPSAATNLSYTGSAQDLLSSKGAADNGSMVFRLGTSGDFSDTIPQAINAGSYTVYYKAKGTGNYADSAVSYVTVTINKATPTSPTTPTISNSVDYGTKLSDISLGNEWIWESGTTVPNVDNTGYTAVYNKTLDTDNYNWNSVDGYDSASNKIKRTIVVPVDPVEKTDETFTVPTNLSATYNSSKTLNQQISLPANWAWEDGTVTPQVSDTAFTAVYTVPSPDNKNYNWEGVNGYAKNDDTITITRDLPVTISHAAQAAPSVTATAEEKFGQENGKINGVTTEMEYRKAEETEYTQITENDLTEGSLIGLAPGTYYVRYKAKTNYNASPETMVTIAEGTKLKVTFPTETERTTAGYEIAYTTNPDAIKWQEDYTFTVTLADGYSDETAGGIKVMLDGSETPLAPSSVNTEGTAPVYTYTIPAMEADHTVAISGVTHYTDELEIADNIDFGTQDYGVRPDAKPIVINNLGNRDGMIKSVTVTGTNADKFEISGSETTVPNGGNLADAYTIRPKANVSVGTYTATINVIYYKDAAKTEAKTATATKTVTYSVQPKSLAEADITIVNAATLESVYYYTAKPVTVALKDANGNIIDPSEYSVIYSNNTAVSTAGTPASVAITDASPSGGDYTIPATTKTFEIQYLDAEVAAQATGDTKNDSGWFTGDVTLNAPAGYTINTANTDADTGWSGSLAVTAEGTTNQTYYLKRTSDGAITDAKTATIKIDRLAPSAILQVGDDIFNTYTEPNDISFTAIAGTVKTTGLVAGDTGSGSVKTYYYFSETPISSTVIADVNWTAYPTEVNAVTTPEGKSVLYIKAVDAAGNAKYISSKGINIDTEAPVVEGVTDGKTYCGAKTVTVTDANLDKVLVNNAEVVLTNGAYTLTADGTTYTVAATDKAGHSTTVTVTVNEGHTPEVDEAVAPTCTKTGLTAGSHCAVCEEVLEEQQEVPALGHDWSGEWKVTREATAETEGRKELACGRPGCECKRYETIPVFGEEEEPENPNAGQLQKDAEVAEDAPVETATLDNKKSELFEASAIFTTEEKEVIRQGSDARVWIEVTKTDVESIPAGDKADITEAVKTFGGEASAVTYFDVDLFKQITGQEKTTLHEPGIAIKVTIQIPAQLLNTDKTIVREYKIIRLHTNARTGESRVDVLDGAFYPETGEFSFVTDKFSTYAIVYRDTQLVTGVTLAKNKATLTSKGETLQLAATVAPENATDKRVTWTSSNTNVAIVDENGKVTAVADGTCTITATTVDGGMTATCVITVAIPVVDEGDQPAAPDAEVEPVAPEKTPNPDKKNNLSSPATGDMAHPVLWMAMMLLAVLAIAGVWSRRKKDCR